MFSSTMPDFRLLYVPIVYLPYATLPASRGRQSGFMIPDAGSSTAKGFFFGDSYYWAPTDWMDAMVGATFLSKRGWSQRGDIRMRPWENVKLDISYYGVIDRGLPEPGGIENRAATKRIWASTLFFRTDGAQLST